MLYMYIMPFPPIFDLPSDFSTFFLEKNHMPSKEWRKIMIPGRDWLTHESIYWVKTALFSPEGIPAMVTISVTLSYKLCLLPQHCNPQTQASGEGDSLPPPCRAFYLPLAHQILSHPALGWGEGNQRKTSPWASCSESLFLTIYFWWKAIPLSKMDIFCSIYIICRYSQPWPPIFLIYPLVTGWKSTNFSLFFHFVFLYNIITISKWLRIEILNSSKILVGLDRDFLASG